MFLVYVPIIFVSLYFCSKGVQQCIPSSARRIISRAVSDVLIVVAFTVARTTRYLSALRSVYIWEKRARLSRFFVGVLDALLRVDTDQARLDTSSGHESIQILMAISTVSGHDYDITHVIEPMWSYGNGIRIDISINDALGVVGCENDSGEDIDVTTRIRYRGHSNISKMYPSETFSARYVCKDSQIFRFPPYASSESVRRGLSVPRIVRCNFVKENGKLMFGPEARESAGLRRNFYENVEDDPCLQKNVVTFFDAPHRFEENHELVVTTSKSKIFCNLQVPPKLA